MATYLETVNQVLVRLRENSVTSVADTAYSRLIGKFVNDAKRECEDAWKWTALRSLVSVTTVTSTSAYALTGTNRRTRILEGYNTTHNNNIFLMNSARYNRWVQLQSTSDGPVSYYRPRGVVADELNIELLPVPTGAQALTFECLIPQNIISADATAITIPSEPIELGAWSKAISERGEDGGAVFDESVGAYKFALSDAIAFDEAQTVGETDWMPV